MRAIILLSIGLVVVTSIAYLSRMTPEQEEPLLGSWAFYEHMLTDQEVKALYAAGPSKLTYFCVVKGFGDDGAAVAVECDPQTP